MIASSRCACRAPLLKRPDLDVGQLPGLGHEHEVAMKRCRFVPEPPQRSVGFVADVDFKETVIGGYEAKSVLKIAKEDREFL